MTRPNDGTEDFDERCTGTESCECPDCLNEAYADPGDDGGNCHWCGGDGWVACDDPIQCTYPHDKWGNCPCSSCGGSGRAKDMTIW